MKIAITDANIFIDLHHLQFTDFLFGIDLEIYTSHSVFNELNPQQQEALDHHIEKGNLRIIHFSAQELDEMNAVDLPRGLSPQDKSVIYLASKHISLVLSGDIKLRKYCNSVGFEVHGIIWLFDQFLEKEHIDFALAISKMKALMAVNTWLPTEDCLKKIEHWNDSLN